MGASYQDDMSWQLMNRVSHSWLNPDYGFLKAQFVSYYAKSIGLSDNSQIDANIPNDTYAVSSQLLWNKNKVTAIAFVGQVGKKLATFNPDIDTDVGFPFDQSIDSNHNDMFSWQLAGFYQFTQT